LLNKNFSCITLNFLYRYRNFKTFVSPRPVQFSCVAIDSTGEFIAAGGQDVFEAYLWSMKIGKLLEVRI
jgi:periodic tryptophan protein 2